MSQARRFMVVDAFSAKPLLGNPVAVVLDGAGLDTAAMQAIARWTNLSETTFVLPPTDPQADYRLRIFTPGSELPFAGHPTLGSAHAVLQEGRIQPRQPGRLVQQCGVGLVNVAVTRVTGESGVEETRLTLALPPAKVSPLTPAMLAELQDILGLAEPVVTEPATIDVGPVWTVLHLPDAQTVLKLQPDLTRLADYERRQGITGIIVFGPHAAGRAASATANDATIKPSTDAAIEVRAFAPSCGVNEDPVCGSGNGCAAVYQWARGLLPAGGHQYVAAQGQCVGRDGRVHVSVDAAGNVQIGGACVTGVDGRLTV